MDPLTLSIITIITIAIGMWSGVVATITGRIMFCAFKERGEVRTSDLVTFLSTVSLTIATFTLVFVWPGLIYIIPSTVAFVEIASIPVLGYLTELAFKHWKRMRKSIRSQVDEHAVH